MERTILVIDDDRRLFGLMARTFQDVDFVGHLVIGDCHSSRIRQYEPSLVVIADSCLGSDPSRQFKHLLEHVAAPFIAICSLRDRMRVGVDPVFDAGVALMLGALDSFYRGDAADLIRARIHRACQLTRALYPATGLIAMFGDVQFDVSHRHLMRGHESVQLGHIESRIVAALARAGGERISRSDLFELGWRDELEPNDRRLDVRISAINHKLDGLTEGRVRIACIRNLGYCLTEGAKTHPRSVRHWQCKFEQDHLISSASQAS